MISMKAFAGIAALLLVVAGCDLFAPASAPAEPAMESEAMKADGSTDVLDGAAKPAMEAEGMEARIEYLDYSREEFEAALADGRVIFLEYWAAWCPICKKMDPDIRAAFAELDADASLPRDIVGFRVNFDTDTDMNRRFGVSSQHTHIILGRDGKEAYRSLAVLSKDAVKEEVLRVAST